MARIEPSYVKEFLAAKGIEMLGEYKNLETPINCFCDQGHVFSETFKNMRKDHFVCPMCFNDTFKASGLDKDLPQKTGDRLVSLDLASKNIGVAVFDNRVLVGQKKITIKGDFNERLYSIYHLLVDICLLWSPDQIILEDIQLQENVQTFKMLAELQGIAKIAILNADRNIETMFVLPTVWRKIFGIGGERYAEKRKAIELVKEKYGLVVGDDVAEAILIGVYGCRLKTPKLF